MVLPIKESKLPIEIPLLKCILVVLNLWSRCLFIKLPILRNHSNHFEASYKHDARAY